MSTTKEFKIKIDDNFEEVEENLDGVNKGLKETKTAAKGVSDSGATATSQMNALGASKFTGLLASIGGVVKALFTLRGAIIATGIGAFLILITSVKQAFQASEEGQNKYAKLLKITGTIFENFLDLLADFGESVISAFENPLQAIKNFAKALKERVLTSLQGMLELIPALGNAIVQLFSGDFREAANTATNALGKIVLGVDDVTDKIKDATEATKAFIAEQEREAKIAGQIADKRAKADKIDRALLVTRAKLQSEIAQLKLKSRQEETVSAEDRKQALIDAQKLEDSLLAKEIASLKLRRDAVVEENKLARSNKEALDREARANADLLNIQTRRLDAQRSTQRELNRVNKEIAAAAKARATLEKKALALGLEFTKEVTNEELKTRITAKTKELKEVAEFNKKLIATQKVQDALSIEVMAEGIEKEQAKLMAKYDSQIVLAEGNAELQRQLTQKLESDLVKVRKDSLAKQKVLDDKATEERIVNQKKLNASKVDLASQGFGALANLVSSFEAKDKESAKRQFKVNKALQIGQTVASTASGIMQQLAVPQDALTGLNFVKAGIVAATGAASLVKIAGSKFDGGEGGGSAPEIASGGGSQAPSFNVVGNSGINQIAQLQTEPTRAYVVSGEVTSQQALDRNREMNATL